MVPEWGVAEAEAVLEGKALRPVTVTPCVVHELLYSDQKEKKKKSNWKISINIDMHTVYYAISLSLRELTTRSGDSTLDACLQTIAHLIGT